MWSLQRMCSRIAWTGSMCASSPCMGWCAGTRWSLARTLTQAVRLALLPTQTSIGVDKQTLDKLTDLHGSLVFTSELIAPALGRSNTWWSLLGRWRSTLRFIALTC